MSVTQVHNALGSFEIELVGAVPREVLDEVQYFGHVAIIPGRLDPKHYGDGCLQAARYVGVLRRIKFADDGRTNLIQDDIKLGGVGMEFWLGDEEEKGAVIEAETIFNLASFASAITDLIPTSLTAGNISAAVTGTYSGRHQYETPRTAIKYVCDTMSSSSLPVGYKVTNDGLVHAGYESDLFVTTPQCIVVRKGTSSGEDMSIRALPSTVDLDQDMEDFSTRVVMLAESDGASLATGTADIDTVAPGTNVYKDLQGNPLKLTRMVSESETTEINADVRAELALRETIETHRTLTVAADDYDIHGSFEVGDYIYIYDPDGGLVDLNNEVYIRGVRINPMKLRVVEINWPITEGYTVAFRDGDGNWFDLTDYIKWEEEQPTQVTVGDFNRELSGSSNPARGRLDAIQGGVGGDATTPNPPTFLDPFPSSAYEDANDNLRAQITVEWATPTNTDSSAIDDGHLYEIGFKPTTETVWSTHTVGWGTNELLLTDLLPNTQYDFRIRASDSNAHWSLWSTTYQQTVSGTQTVPGKITPAPTVSSDSAEDSSGVLKSFASVSWTQPTNTDTTAIVDGASYEVQYKLSTAATWTSQMVGWGTTSTLILNLNPGALYNFKVRAIDTAGNTGEFSDTSNATMASSASTPGSVTIGTITSDVIQDASGTSTASVLVPWTQPTNTNGSTIIDGSYYEVQYKKNADTTYTSQNVAWGTTSVYLPNLVPATLYNFRVRAVDNSGRMGAFPTATNHTTSASASIPAAPSTAPAGYAISTYEINGRTRARIVATWSTPLNTNGTTIIDGGSYEINYRIVGQTNWQVLTVPWGVNEALISDLEPNTSYEFRMRALDNNGNASSYTATAPRTTGGLTVPGQVTSVTATTGNGSSYEDGNGLPKARQLVTWGTPTNTDTSAITDGSHYEVHVRLQGLSDWTAYNVAWGTNSLLLTDLAVNTGYEVRVRAVDLGGNRGAWSSTVQFTSARDQNAPSVPAAPLAVASPVAVQIVHNLGKNSGGGTFNLETDLAELEVHKGTNGFTASTSTYVGSLRANKGMIQGSIPAVGTFSVGDTSTMYFRVIAVDTSGNKSAQSPQVSASPGLVMDSHIDNLTATKITAGTLSANVLLAAAIRTAASPNARVELNQTGLQAFNSSNVQTVDIKNDGTFFLKSGTSGARIELLPTGIKTYNSGGAQTVNIGNDGSFYLKSGTTGQRIEMDPAGIRTYDPDGELSTYIASNPSASGDYISFRNTAGEAVASINQEGTGSFNSVSVANTLSVGGKTLDEILYSYPRGVINLTMLTGTSPGFTGTTTTTAVDGISAGWIVIPNAEVGRQYVLGGSNLHFDRGTGGPDRINLAAFLKYDGIPTPSDTQLFEIATLTSAHLYSGGDTTYGGDHGISFRHPFTLNTVEGTDLYLGLFFFSEDTSGQLKLEGKNGARIYVEDMGAVVTYGTHDLSNTSTGGSGQVQQYTKTYYATWNRSYAGNDTSRLIDNSMYHGQYSSTWGNQKALIGFDMTQIMADLSGATIQKVTFTAYAKHWYYSTGGTARLGTHEYATTQSTWVGTGTLVYNNRPLPGQADGAVTNWPKPGKKTVTLPNLWAEEMRDGTTKGIALGPAESTTKTEYGIFAGVNDSANKPYLTITYTK